MKKEHIVIIVLVILLLVSVAWVISSQPKGKQWVTVGSWSGSEADYNMTTELFKITGEEWRIYWRYTEIIGGSHFDIIVYDAYTDNVVKEIETSYPQTFEGESYLNTKGRFYLEIFIRGDLGNWQVFVSEYR